MRRVSKYLPPIRLLNFKGGIIVDIQKLYRGIETRQVLSQVYTKDKGGHECTVTLELTLTI